MGYTVTSLYYIDYPDGGPADPAMAFTEAYAEIGDESSRQNDFLFTVAFTLCTPAGLKEKMAGLKTGFLLSQCVLVVDKFDDQRILDILEQNIDDIVASARRKP